MYNKVDPKPDFPALEREQLKSWEKTGLVKKYLQKNNSSSKKFSFLDGPITANNPMGVHHAWGRTYKDFWQRFHNMTGYKQRFINGFDEQGLWVEVEVEKELGLNSKKEIENLIPQDKEASIAKFISLCKERVKKFASIQTKQSQRLGYFMDWENSYHTSSDENNYKIWGFLKKVYTDGNLYKGHDTVPWCPRCGTAISQHEILTEEYKVVPHRSVFVKYPVPNKNLSLLVWTTTPWTLPGNVAIAVNSEFKYRLLKNEETGEILVVVRGGQGKLSSDEEKAAEQAHLIENILADTLKGKGYSGLEDIDGKDMVGWVYESPFDDLERVKKAKSANPKTFHTVINAPNLVSATVGTGLVHIAPSAGEEDFKLSKENKLPVIELIDEEATYLPELGDFSGRNAKSEPEIILGFLRETEGGEFYFKEKEIKHRYPTCWRCKTELVWRVVDEWYIAVDQRDGKGRDLRNEMMTVTKKINWIPDWGRERELDWLKNMHDWLISKKRYWGLALPIYECSKCHHFEVIGSKEELKEKAVKGWSDFEGHTPHRPWVDQVKIKCANCEELVSRIGDVGNPWLDAGIVPYSTLPEEWFPADLVGESFPGQFKNWFYSMIAMSTVIKGTNPFQNLFGYASMRDEKGEEMHKSKGNAIWFDDGAEQIGVDVMRWLFVTHNPELNLGFGYTVTDQVRRQFFLMLWNVYKFFVDYANTDSFYQTEIEIVKSKNVLDLWILSRLNQLINIATKNFSGFQTTQGALAAEQFLNDLSVWYLRRSRERMGPTVPKGEDKTDAYQTMHFVLTTLMKVLAPLIPFTTEMIFTNLTKQESVHLTDWPVTMGKINERLIEQMSVARQVVEKGHSQRKENNIKVRQPLSEIVYYCEEKLPSEIEKLILDELNIKKISYQKADDLKVKINLKLTPKLKAEGDAREIVRQIQEKRKELNVGFDTMVNVVLTGWPTEFEDYIKKETLAKTLTQGEKFDVKL